ncbi:MAG: transcriptional regulator [Verrucomicrobiota bacterium]
MSSSTASNHRPLDSTPLESAEGLSVFEAEVVALFVDFMQLLGMPKSYGEIYGLLYASPEALTFAQIEQKLDLSKGSISQGLRALRELGAVTAQAAPNGVAAREVFLPQTELRRLVSILLQDRLVPYLRAGEQRLAAIDAALVGQGGDVGEKADKHSPAKLLRTRAEKLRSWQKRSSAVLPLVAKLLH